MKLGFTSVVVNGQIRPQFVLRLEDLAHGSLKKPYLSSKVCTIYWRNPWAF